MSFNHVSNNNDDTVDNVNEQFIYESPSSFSILRTQPAFIGKLYKMLEDDTQDLICWSTDGDYFSVYNSALFAKQVLPQYFKHNNWQSFVRQLNMYGFSKINEMIHSNISFDNQTWDFKHPHFKRGDFQSLSLVKRKSVKSSSTTISSPSSSSSSYNTSQNDIINTKSQQQPSQQCDSFDENDIVHNRVGLLDEQVHQVSNNVNQLTNDVQDIKSIIYQQQNIIHDLANMVRSYQDPSSVTSLSTPGKESRQGTISLPSIQHLSNNLQTTILSKPRLPSSSSSSSISHHHPRPLYSSSSSTVHPSSSNTFQSPLDSRRRSSHPSTHHTNSLYPLLNSISDDHADE